MNREAIERCFRDRWWRLNNLYWILDKAGNPVKFQPNKAQAEYLRNRHYLNVILKARQLGFSTAIQIDMLDRCLFNTNYKAGVIAQNKDTAIDIFENKLKFAFDSLPDALKDKFKPKQDSARKLEFQNGSSVTVGTSLRGGTLQQLHVSELGTIAMEYPAKAREIRTGAFNTVASGQIIDVESTAKGQEGEFYDRCNIAQQHTDAAKAENRALRDMEWKFHFFPWWRDPQYATNPKGVPIPARLERYFDTLRDEHGIKLAPGQKAWYVLKESDQGAEDMHREYPSFPEEAFQVAIEGAFYASHIRQLRQDGKLMRIPVADELPVHTAWDLGMNDMTAIWFFQIFGREIRLIDYFEGSDHGFAYYARILEEKGYTYGSHFGPHDLEVRELFSSDGEQPKTRREIAAGYGIRFETIERVQDMRDGREAVRQLLPNCVFDFERCEYGIKALEHYRREWDANKGVYSNNPRHDWASHGAKAFETLARAPLFSSGQHGARPIRTSGRMGAWL